MGTMNTINFKKWIDEHRDLLKPPVANKVVWTDSEFIVMVVGGPNQRTDYHINEGEEFFYQVEGDMLLKCVNKNGEFEDIPIKEGEIFLLPPNTPHSPQRFENTIGLVIERKRRAEEKDGLRWYCQNCGNKLYEEFFHLNNIEVDLPPVFERYYSSEDNRTCNQCGELNDK
ncbi:MAG: 3-hydroxyanthranilate 3,4-dioxygenase [Bacteriovoracaceae bacterium]